VYDIPTRTSQTSLGISQLLSSGATAKLSAINNYYANQYSLGGTENYWRSGVSLSISQPLLKNFGRDTTMLAIDVARLTNEGNREQYRTKLMNSLATTRTNYFTLYGLREELTARKTSLKLAQQIEQETKARFSTFELGKSVFRLLHIVKVELPTKSTTSFTSPFSAYLAAN
jgi:outer membrane protein TolC